MSDSIQHECGVALVRLLKPLEYFADKYGTPLHGFNQLFLLMEKQHNRGQDGAGIGAVKLGMPAGLPYMFRERDVKANALSNIFNRQLKAYRKLVEAGAVHPEFPKTVKEHWDFGAEILVGHLRYGTSGSYLKSATQPYFRKSAWPTRNLMLAGNFNMTNTERLNARLVNRGTHPIFDTDTQTVLEEIGFHLDEEHTRIYHELRDTMPGDAIPREISRHLDIGGILRQAGSEWDGGYTLAGLIGNGDCFVLRDPHGIRPAYYFHNDEIAAFASERVPLMTIFAKDFEAIHEVPPGAAIVIKSDGSVHEERIHPERPRTSCSFERIYFSRGNDAEIYAERKALGAALSDSILGEIGGDFSRAVFSFIPNTAEIAYYGMLDEMRRRRRQQVKDAILHAAAAGTLDEATLDALIMDNWPRSEKIAHKDIKLRTFISQEKNRLKLASHVYDISYGVIRPEDCLVCIDDSIVRGTTLKQSIIRILARTRPRKIVIASTAPQIRYPDCYGIDMSELGKFVAFQAAISLLKETGRRELLREVYQDCVGQLEKPDTELTNHVRRIYEPFSAAELSARISRLVSPEDIDWDGEVRIIYQSIESLHQAIPGHTGDWYFTGKYPTPGGLRVLNQAYINYYEKREGRSY
jgi:amidophosphoribosyltransferase